MTTGDYITKVKEAINEDGEYFTFICNDVIHALSVIDLFNNVSIISYSKSPLTELLIKDGIQVFLLEDEYPRFDMLRTTNNLIAHDYTKSVINRIGAKKNLMVFKNSFVVEEYADKLGLRLLASEAKVSRGIENKISFYGFLQGKGIDTLPGEILLIADSADYNGIVKKYGEPFVLQAAKGFGGNKTFIIKSEDEFASLKKAYHKRQLRLTKFVHGATMTVNACATELGTIMKPPFYQLTGIDTLSANKMAACGNDFFVGNVENGVINGIARTTEMLGEMLYQKGFKGLFGVDYLVSESERYLIECNPRFVTSLPVFTGIELLNDEPPLIAFHVLEHLGKMNRVKDVCDRFKTVVNNYSGSQIIMHNLSSEAKKIRTEMKCGIYEFSGGALKFIKESYRFDDITGDMFLIIPKAYGDNINGGMECARIMTKGRALNESRLGRKVEEIVEYLYKELFSEDKYYLQ